MADTLANAVRLSSEAIGRCIARGCEAIVNARERLACDIANADS
jgi:hypothetical protein